MDILKNKIITPHWMMRLLGTRAATIVISSDGLILERTRGERLAINTENLTRKDVLRRGMLFFELVLPTDSRSAAVEGVEQIRGGGVFRLVAGLLVLAGGVSKVSFRGEWVCRGRLTDCWMRVI